jgi:peptidyl-prolyl cis-trans isomerase C
MAIPRIPGLLSCVLAALLCCAPPAFGADAADTVLISNGVASVTRAEYDAELLKLPPDLRVGFANNPRRVTDLLVRMLVQKSLAAQAKAEKIDTTPNAVLRLRLEADRILSQIMVESIEAKAAAEFDANRAKYEVRARESFLIDKSKYATPEQVSATHILFDTKKHTSDEARKLAQDARAKILAGADMGRLAHDVSEDPSSGTNNGSLGWFSQKEMDPAFGAAAFALKNPGDVSEPVLSQFGWHVIRLDGRRPASVPTFDQARDTIMADLRKGYIDEKREEAVNAIRRDPKTTLNREAVEAIIPKVDVDQAKRAIEATTPAGAAAPAPAPVAR